MRIFVSSDYSELYRMYAEGVMDFCRFDKKLAYLIITRE